MTRTAINATKNVISNRKSKATDGNKVNGQKNKGKDSNSHKTIVLTTLKPYDIICGRSKAAFCNVGNKRFRVTISMNLKKYNSEKTKKAKSMLILSIVKTLKESAGARFLKPVSTTTSSATSTSTSRWLEKRLREQEESEPVQYVELSDKQAAAKVGHALRDLVTAQENKSKKNEAGDASEVDSMDSMDILSHTDELSTSYDNNATMTPWRSFPAKPLPMMAAPISQPLSAPFMPVHRVSMDKGDFAHFPFRPSNTTPPPMFEPLDARTSPSELQSQQIFSDSDFMEALSDISVSSSEEEARGGWNTAASPATPNTMAMHNAVF